MVDQCGVNTQLFAGLLPLFGCLNIAVGFLMALHYCAGNEPPPPHRSEDVTEEELPEVEEVGEYVSISSGGVIVGGFYK